MSTSGHTSKIWWHSKNRSAHIACICATPEHEKMAKLFRWTPLQNIFSKLKANSWRLHGLLIRLQENEGGLYTKDKESDWDVSSRYHWTEVNLWNFPACQPQAWEIPIATNVYSVMSWRGAFPVFCRKHINLIAGVTSSHSPRSHRACYGQSGEILKRQLR